MTLYRKGAIAAKELIERIGKLKPAPLPKSKRGAEEEVPIER